ncbi:MAG: metal-dependent phosphohydrolase [Telmatospirillum sp.]|nr:metal-dependent phosphohydrolase [Telmatospirillum sp.]
MSGLPRSRNWSRRDCFRLLACGASAAALSQIPGLSRAAEGPGRLTLAQCQAMGPVEMAKSSRIVTEAYDFIQSAAGGIASPELRRTVLDVLRSPAPSILNRFRSDADKEEIRRQLVARKLLAGDVTIAQLFPPARDPSTPPQPFLSAPGSAYNGHHAYPGGLCVHTAFNTRNSLGLAAGYRDTIGIELDHDVILASQLLHDQHKPWVFQWTADGSLLTEYTVAGTGAHHILGVAESIHRGLPADVVVAQASAHDHPGSPADEAKTVGYLKAAAIIAGQDPVAAGYLGPDGATVPLPRHIEGFLTHLGDHDWVIAGAATGWCVALLQEIARQDYGLSEKEMGSARFNALRNYVFSQRSIMGLHELHVTKGREAVRAAVHDLVIPA